MGEFFSDGGKLAKAKGYESRPGQAKMAERVAEKLPAKYDLIINVPPGSTKTVT
jgi:hypothetical protein